MPSAPPKAARISSGIPSAFSAMGCTKAPKVMPAASSAKDHQARLVRCSRNASESELRSQAGATAEPRRSGKIPAARSRRDCSANPARSEEHTSELQSRGHLVCRLLLEKKKTKEPV